MILERQVKGHFNLTLALDSVFTVLYDQYQIYYHVESGDTMK